MTDLAGLAQNIQAKVESLMETRLGQIGAGAAAIAGVAAVSYLMSSGPEPTKPIFDVNNQTVDLGNGVRCSPLLKEMGLTTPLERVSDEMDTLHSIFLTGLKKSKNGKCLGARTGPNKEYVFQTYKQVFDRVRAFGSGLLRHGLKPRPNTFIGVYSQNRPEWVITEQACNAYSMVLVPLYDTLGPAACQYVINHMELTTVVCDTPLKAQALLDSAQHTPSLKTIIIIEDFTPDVTKHAESHGIQILSFSDVEINGNGNLQDTVPPKPSDLATVCFTSGTTGNPKGVMLTHGNLAAQLAGLNCTLSDSNRVEPSDCHLSYLPLAHMYERIVQMLLYSYGAHIGFFQGDILKLFDDLQTLKPTIFPSVPRLMNRIKDKVYAAASQSRLKRFLLDWAVSSKMKEVRRGIARRDSIWDRLIFSKIQAMHGGRVRIVFTGSAPIPLDTMNFYKCAMGCNVTEGYGQTEAVAGVCVQTAGDTTFGHVGSPMVCNLVKLEEVPDMGYFEKDNKGEVCVYGPNVTPGYYKDPEKTAEAIDKDGWLHTGDIGMWLPNGALAIIDRKKHIFKLSQGEYVAPEKIESFYASSSFVGQVFVDGDSLEISCMGIVVPDADVMATWATNNGFKNDMASICKSQEIKEVILKDIHAIGKKNGLRGFEQVKDIFLHPDPFTLQDGLMTPTFKNKRPQLRQKFKKEFAELYQKNRL